MFFSNTAAELHLFQGPLPQYEGMEIHTYILFHSQVTDGAPGQRQIGKKILVYRASHCISISGGKKTEAVMWCVGVSYPYSFWLIWSDFVVERGQHPYQQLLSSYCLFSPFRISVLLPFFCEYVLMQITPNLKPFHQMNLGFSWETSVWTEFSRQQSQSHQCKAIVFMLVPTLTFGFYQVILSYGFLILFLWLLYIELISP